MKYTTVLAFCFFLGLSSSFGQEHIENQPNTETTDANWEDVYVTENANEVSELKKIKKISKRSGWYTTKNSRTGYDSAVRLLKIEAARQKCTTVLIIADSSKERPNKVKGTLLTAVLYR